MITPALGHSRIAQKTNKEPQEAPERTRPHPKPDAKQQQIHPKESKTKDMKQETITREQIPLRLSNEMAL